MLRLDQVFLRQRFALSLCIGQSPQAVLQLVVDIFRHERDLFVHLVLETKFRKRRLQFFVQLKKFLVCPLPLGRLVHRLPQIEMLIHLGVHCAHLRRQFLQRL